MVNFLQCDSSPFQTVVASQTPALPKCSGSATMARISMIQNCIVKRSVRSRYILLRLRQRKKSGPVFYLLDYAVQSSKVISQITLDPAPEK
jgi:hypothetical protein